MFILVKELDLLIKKLDLKSVNNVNLIYFCNFKSFAKPKKYLRKHNILRLPKWIQHIKIIYGLIIVKSKNNFFLTILDMKTGKVINKISAGMLEYYNVYKAYPEGLFKYLVEYIYEYLKINKINFIYYLKCLNLRIKYQKLLIKILFQKKEITDNYILRVNMIYFNHPVGHNGIKLKKKPRK